MIGEPELDGEWESVQPTETAQPGAVGDPVRGPRRPWLWALGGALLASAVWAGTLAAQDRFTDAPRIAYRHSEDLCKEVPLTAVSGATAKLSRDIPRHAEHPALDWSACTYSADHAEGRLYFQADALVQLHKQTDPRAEFGAGPGTGAQLWDSIGIGELEQVPGLGERALLSRQARGPRLQVLDGGAVFTLHVGWFGEPNVPEPDEDAVKAAMIEDMRALMAAVKK
ncbi:hypothetical protein ACGFYQ_04190 [Streptomyces sp. NPDC048258]|uniref:hypothetical protein n=1 Tax=Streptomyces sp. NPDC048258 TaxID=3365527 RepID=UPI003717FDFC